MKDLMMTLHQLFCIEPELKELGRKWRAFASAKK